jgi:cyanamide hydratase
MSSTTSKTPNSYGWHAVPRNPATILEGKTHLHDPKPQTISSLTYPDTPRVQASLKYAREHLPRQTLNHSLRVYYFGISIISTQFPTWLSSNWIDPETWMLACLWHDIGTTDDNLKNTHMSFDLWGGCKALTTLQTSELGEVPQSQAESVAEAVLRHQDPGETGMITCMGWIIQVATLLDNAGQFAELMHRDTVRNVAKEFPREGWSGCFAGTIRREIETKPWAHSTAIENFAEMVEGNEGMREFD